MNPENKDKIISLRHLLHANPELSMQEINTRHFLIDFLKKYTRLEIREYGHWFCALYHAPVPGAPMIAFRADMDALPIPEGDAVPKDHASLHPGVSHKCGHDGHCAALAGFALEVWQKQPSVNVCFLFQHAEETGQGGRECAEFLADAGCAAVYAVHNLSGYPENSIICRRGLAQCASRGLTLYFHGRASHASQPEDGLSPAGVISQMVPYSQSLLHSHIFREKVLCTVIHIRMGEKDFGIAPGEGEISFTIRANLESDLELLEQLLREKAAGLAAADGLSMEYQITDPFPETRNHDSAITVVEQAAKRLGKERIRLPEPWRASEDFGYYTKKCPGAIFYVGNGTDYAPLHSTDYDFNNRILESIVDMYLEILAEYC